MNLKVIINAIIIVAVLHMLIVNIDYKEVIGKRRIEMYENKKSEEESQEESLNFLTTEGEENDNTEISSEGDIKEQLLNYVKKEHFGIREKATDIEGQQNEVLPGNFYQSDNNRPNFESNVANVSKFYKNNFDNLNANDLKDLSCGKKLVRENQSIDGISRQPCNVINNANQPTIRPDVWTYQNELPMNGGGMNGIVGFDSLDSQYAIYDTSCLNVKSCNENAMDVVPPSNDIRKPDIIN